MVQDKATGKPWGSGRLLSAMTTEEGARPGGVPGDSARHMKHHKQPNRKQRGGRPGFRTNLFKKDQSPLDNNYLTH